MKATDVVDEESDMRKDIVNTDSIEKVASTFYFVVGVSVRPQIPFRSPS